jgi:hypothetical protein
VAVIVLCVIESFYMSYATSKFYSAMGGSNGVSDGADMGAHIIDHSAHSSGIDMDFQGQVEKDVATVR